VMPAFYIVSTPIGNLGDISMRALETLRSVDVIACEDTRHTRILLDHYQIAKPLTSFHEHNEDRAVEQLRRLHAEGKSVALVTDAGSPGISDPGFTLIRMAIREGLEVTAIPGASAVLPALVLSGLPVHSFTFRGFLPQKPGARLRFYGQDREMPYTLVYYESPYRIIRSLEDALNVLGDRHCAVANDLTKKFERVWRGTLAEVLAQVKQSKVCGEYTIVIEGLPKSGREAPESERVASDGPDDSAEGERADE
jgi:16S rRNA (cytidine1402-2'-O)-methyltransferase